MRRTSGDNAVCFKSLEKELAQSPETYKCLDLIAFGFPCQDISGANPKGKGLKGKKSSIFFECMRIVEILKPTWVLVENVPRLLSINGGQDMAIVLQTLAKCGYGWSYRLLDSQYFNVAQRRKRVFIVGCLGKPCPPEILFEPQSGSGNGKKERTLRERGLCLTSRSGERQDPTAETFIASTVQSFDNKLRKFGFGSNLVASTIQATDYQKIQHGQFGNEGNPVASTLGTSQRGNAKFIWQDTYIAETDANGKRISSGISERLESDNHAHRGVVLGNAVTVNVAQWIGERIIKYGGSNERSL